MSVATMPLPVEFLPDFCTGERVVRVLVVSEAVAVLLALGGGLGEQPVARFLLLSVYLQWIGICSAAALCLIRRYAGELSALGMAALAWITLLAVTFAITEITFVAGRFTGFGVLLAHTTHLGFLARSLAICAVVCALALRYFWLRSAWRAQAQAEMRARLEALQARIEPHFLFNTLNNVAALIDVRPAEAERALEDLSALLRARLAADAPAETTLADEMTLVEAYARIERLRLGERLRLVLDIADDARACRLPGLSLQPLVENAIGHGVARLPAGGTVHVTARCERDRLLLRVTNPLAGRARDAPGNRQALANIRHRLALRYGKAARLSTHDDHSSFVAELCLPAHGPADMPAGS